MIGKRKLIVILVYLFGNFGIAWIVAQKCGDLTGVGVMAVGLMTGVAAFVYGNSREHEAKNGG